MTAYGEPPDLQTDRAHSARIYNYWLGGKDNYAADREAADATVRAWPAVLITAQVNRAFMHRAAHYLAAECGIRQFLDVGTGIPASPNLHEIVQEVDPSSRVLYADNDPIVLAHARALLSGDPRGVTAYIDADLRRPEGILDAPELRATLDLDRPVGLMIIAVLHFIEDDELARGVVRQLVDALPSGSYVALSMATADFDPERLAIAREEYRSHGGSMAHRSAAEVTRFFDGLDLVEPGVVQTHAWRPDAADVGTIDLRDDCAYAAVARKP